MSNRPYAIVVKRTGVSREHALKNNRKWQTIQTPQNQQKNNTSVVTPYVQGVSGKVKRVFSSYGIVTCFKSHQTLRQILVAPKDKTKTEDQTGVVYLILCGGCNKVYVLGETKRTIGERIKEHTTKITKHV